MDNMKNKIKEGLFSLAPDCFDEIMERTPVRVESEEELLGSFQESPGIKKTGRRRIMSVVSAAAVLFLGIFSWSMYNQFHTVDQIYIDVNPSICLSLNKAGKVTKAEGINPEGKEIIDQVEEELKESSEVDVIFDVLLDELDSGGYFQDHEMDMLLSYCYSDSSRTELLEGLTESAQTYAHEHDMEAFILAQSFSKDDPAVSEGLAKGISPGKCYLLNELEEKYNVDLEDFELLSLKDLKEYAEANNFYLEALVSEPAEEDQADLEDEQDSAEEDSTDTDNLVADSETDQKDSVSSTKAVQDDIENSDNSVEKQTNSQTGSKASNNKKSGTGNKSGSTSSNKKKSASTNKKKSKRNKKSTNTTNNNTNTNNGGSENDESPVTSDKTKQPDASDTTQVADQPDTPATTEEPDQPDTPATTEEPDQPDTPAATEEADQSDTSETTEESNESGDSDHPGWWIIIHH